MATWRHTKIEPDVQLSYWERSVGPFLMIVDEPRPGRWRGRIVLEGLGDDLPRRTQRKARTLAGIQTEIAISLSDYLVDLQDKI